MASREVNERFYRFLPRFDFPWVRSWDNRDECHTVGKRIQCLSNVSQHLQPFLQVIGRKLRHFHTPPLFSAPQGVTPSEFREDV